MDEQIHADGNHRQRIERERDQLLEREQMARASAELAAARIARLQAVTAAFSQALTPEQVIDVVIDQGLAVQGAFAGSISLLNDDRTALEIVRARGYPAEVLSAWERIPIDMPVPLAEVVRTGEPIWLETLAQRLERYPHFASPQTLVYRGAIAALPLIAHGRIIGSMGLSFVEERRFDAEDRAFIQALVQQCAQALDRAQLYAAEQQARARAEAAQARMASLYHELQAATRRKDEALALLDALVQRAPIGFAFLDTDLRYQMVNDNLAEMNGRPSADHLGRTVHEILPELAWAIDPLLQHVLITGEPLLNQEISGALPAPPGQTRHALLNFYPVRTQTGQVLGIGAAVTDITTRKRAEERLWQHAQRSKTLRAIDQAILAAQSPVAIAQAALQFVGRLAPCQYASVTAFDFVAGEATVWGASTCSATSMPAGTRFPLEEIPYIAMLQQGQPLLVADLCDLSELAGVYRRLWIDGLRSYISVPIMSQDHLIGSLNLASDRMNDLTRDHLDSMREVAHQLAVAIQNAQLFEQVRLGRERLKMLSQRLVRAQEDERRHIARELHDEIGQSLTAAQLNLQALGDPPGSDARLARLEDSLALIDHVLHQVRALSLNLRPSMLDDLGLVPALRWYVNRQAERTGFAAQIMADQGEERYPSDIETACFRVVQEALTNVTRYARAQHVVVEVRRHDAELCLVIRDDGVGFDVESARQRAVAGHSMGLLSMEERVVLLGGQFQINSTPGQGTAVHARLPVALLDGVPPIDRRTMPR